MQCGSGQSGRGEERRTSGEVCCSGPLFPGILLLQSRTCFRRGAFGDEGVAARRIQPAPGNRRCRLSTDHRRPYLCSRASAYPSGVGCERVGTCHQGNGRRTAGQSISLPRGLCQREEIHRSGDCPRRVQPAPGLSRPVQS